MSFNAAAATQAVQGQSASAFGYSVLTGSVIALVELAGFILLKDRIPKLYQPKSFLVSERQRTTPLSPGPWQWMRDIFRVPNDELLQKCGLDAFFLCRYLIVMIKILAPPALVMLPVLLPINAKGGNNIPSNVLGTGRNQTKGLDIFTLSNVQPSMYDRLWAHLLLAVCLIAWIGYIIITELKYFVKVRQTYLTSPQHRLRASASTVLVQNLPKKYIDPDALAELFDVYPGGIRNIWVNRDYSGLSHLVNERAKIAKNLEVAETKLIQKCWAAHIKNTKPAKQPKGEKQTKVSSSQIDGPAEQLAQLEDPTVLAGPGLSFNNPGQVHHSVDDAVQAINRGEDVANADMAIRKNFLGQGMDAITQGVQNIRRGIGQGLENIGQISNLGNVLSRKDKKRQGYRENKEEIELEEDNNGSQTERYSQDFKKPQQLPYDSFYNNDEHLEARWQNYIIPKDRPTIRMSIKWKWCPAFLNPFATKVDKIYHCRRELARLNRLIEQMQSPEFENNFPLMNSAFIQFNNQAAAHMACQSIAHHTPTYMTPRIVEISPNDIIWQNLSLPAWQLDVRKGIVFMICVGLMILWSLGVAFFASIAQLDVWRKQVRWLAWMRNWNGNIISVIQGVLPPLLVNLCVFLIGVILRILVKYQGTPTRMLREVTVQKYYFVFSFVQYFLVVTIANVGSVVWKQVQGIIGGDFNFFSIPQLLGQQIPLASNYFLSNIVLQSLSQSASGLLQILPLILFVIQAIGHPVARKQFIRRTKLQTVNWGTQYALYTTLASIAIIYSVISPFILPLTFIGFGIWWVSTRYQMLFIYQYTTDTGGLLFPLAVKQLFTGIYTLEVFLVGFFIIVATAAPPGHVKWGIGYSIIMLLTLAATVVFQQIVRRSFGSLWQYLPITLEDDAVKRDEEFAQLLATKHTKEDEDDMMKGTAQGGPEDHDDDDEHEHEQRPANPDLEAQHAEYPPATADIPAIHTTDEDIPQTEPSKGKLKLRQKLDPRNILSPNNQGKRNSWAERGKRSPMYSRQSSSHQTTTLSQPAPARPVQDELEKLQTNDTSLDRPLTNDTKESSPQSRGLPRVPIAAAGDLLNKAIAAPIGFINPDEQAAKEQHSRFAREAEKLYGNIPDDLEELTVEERDILLSRAFTHEALRAKRPCIWLPRDMLGVSDDEVRNTARFSGWIWISNERQGLDQKGRCVYDGPPPDFDQVDLIQL
jgi:calcium permeable stress-gated cation channel